MYIKIPKMELMIILLANSDTLRFFSGFADVGEISDSPFTKTILDTFV